MLRRHFFAATVFTSAAFTAAVPAHGQFLPDKPIPSGVILTLPQKKPISLEDEGIVSLSGEITEKNARRVVKSLWKASHKHPTRRLLLYVDSPGGIVSWGIYIRNAILKVPNPVDVICGSEAKSTAAILVLGHPKEKGIRLAFGKCALMTHAAYYPLSNGKHKTLHSQLTKAERDDLENIRKQFAEYLSKSSNLNFSQALAYVRVKDRDISLKEAHRLGMIDDPPPPPLVACASDTHKKPCAYQATGLSDLPSNGEILSNSPLTFKSLDIR